jgi:hypothetical protein
MARWPQMVKLSDPEHCRLSRAIGATCCAYVFGWYLACLTVSMVRVGADYEISDEYLAALNRDPRVLTRDCGIYFIRCQQLVKIGLSENIPRRLHNLSNMVPFDLQLLAVQPCFLPEIRERELELHERFKVLRHRGEWFRLEEPLTSFIREIAPENAKSPSAEDEGTRS